MEFESVFELIGQLNQPQFHFQLRIVETEIKIRVIIPAIRL